MKKTISLVVSALALLTLGGTALSSTAQASSIDNAQASYSWNVPYPDQPNKSYTTTVYRSPIWVGTNIVIKGTPFVMAFNQFNNGGTIVKNYYPGQKLRATLYQDKQTKEMSWLINDPLTSETIWIPDSSDIAFA